MGQDEEVRLRLRARVKIGVRVKVGVKARLTCDVYRSSCCRYCVETTRSGVHTRGRPVGVVRLSTQLCRLVPANSGGTGLGRGEGHRWRVCRYAGGLGCGVLVLARGTRS